MKKATISSLTKKGYSQKRIAKILGIRKMKVVTAQKALKIGKRVKGGAQDFWKDVKGIKALKEITRKEAIKEVKFAPKWFKKRQKKLTGVAKARDAMRETWQRIKAGEIDRDWWKEPKGQKLIEAADAMEGS